MTDPRIAAVEAGLWDSPNNGGCEFHGRTPFGLCSTCAYVREDVRYDATAAVAALDAYDDAHPLEALAAYRDRVERDVRARVTAEIQAACVTLGCNAAPCTCDAAARIARGDA